MTLNSRKPPAVGTVINLPRIQPLIKTYGRDLVTYSLRKVIDAYRTSTDTESSGIPGIDEIITKVTASIELIATPSLKSLINATGIVLHTNLGRAPLGKKVLSDCAAIISGYSNVEFDLHGGCRGHRNQHVAELLRFITGAQDAVVVNNNAAAIVLILHTFARNREVIISRGELIEIGGSFRIPDIMRAAGAKMVEVGTTNKTRLSDYEQALSKKTALIFKAHRSNFTMSGFIEEVSLQDLTQFSRNHGIPFVYDIGSGLLRKPAHLPLQTEPDVRGVVQLGVDLVTFSCDKLLGGPQGGIVAGRADLVAKCAKDPLMRALRVGKMTISALISSCRSYLSDEALIRDNPAFAMISQSRETVLLRAQKMQAELLAHGIVSEVVAGSAQVGGGTLPDLKLESAAVMLSFPAAEKKRRVKQAEEVFMKLIHRDRPIVAVLREGCLLFELFTVSDEEVADVVTAVKEVSG